MLNMSMTEAFFKFLKGDISALSAEQLSAWERMLRAETGPKQTVGLNVSSGPPPLIVNPANCDMGLKSDKSLEDENENDIDDMDSEEEALSQRLRKAGINLEETSEGRKSEKEKGKMEAFNVVEKIETQLEDRELKSGLDSPTDDDLIDALKEADEASPLEEAAKAWGVVSESGYEKGKSPLSPPSIRCNGRNIKDLRGEELRRSSRQKQKHGGRVPSKDDMIALAAKSKLPISACAGSRKRLRTGALFTPLPEGESHNPP